MSDLYWLTNSPLDRIQPYFPPSRGVPRVDDSRVISGNILKQRTLKPVAQRRRSLKKGGVPRAIGRTKGGYKQRHKVENMFAKLKDWRRIATRYDRCAHTLASLQSKLQPSS